MQFHDLAAPRFLNSLRVLSRLLDKAEAHFRAEGRDLAELSSLRLAPDMQAFPFQIEAVINNTVGAAARLRGVPPPPPERLATVAQMRRALAEAVAALETVAPSDLVGAATREIVLPSPKGDRRMSGLDYLMRLALPNVHFHTAIAYALLRREGLDIGKRDFLGDLPPRAPPGT